MDAAKTERRMTEYLVLERTGSLEEERYDLIGRTQALGAVQAVKAITSDRDLPEDDTVERFAAVPVSNWTAVGKRVKRSEPVVSYDTLPTIEATVPPQEAEAEQQQGLHAVEDETAEPAGDAEPQAVTG